MERTPFRNIIGIDLAIREARNNAEERDLWRRGYLVLERKDTGKMVAHIHPDCFYDQDGNNFSFDAK